MEIIIKIVIVDKKNIYSRGLEFIINSEEDMSSIGIVRGQPNLLKKLKDLSPNVILIHIDALSEKTVDSIHEFKKKYPQVKLIYLFSNFNKYMVYYGLEHNVDGFLLYNLTSEKFISVIKDVYQDQYVLSGEIAEKMLKEIKYNGYFGEELMRKRLHDYNIPISNRESQILYLMYLNKKNSEIADTLQLTEKSVRDYVSRCYRKLNIHNRKMVIEFLKDVMKE